MTVAAIALRNASGATGATGATGVQRALSADGGGDFARMVDAAAPAWSDGASEAPPRRRSRSAEPVDSPIATMPPIALATAPDGTAPMAPAKAPIGIGSASPGEPVPSVSGSSTGPGTLAPRSEPSIAAGAVPGTPSTFEPNATARAATASNGPSPSPASATSPTKAPAAAPLAAAPIDAPAARASARTPAVTRGTAPPAPEHASVPVAGPPAAPVEAASPSAALRAKPTDDFAGTTVLVAANPADDGAPRRPVSALASASSFPTSSPLTAPALPSRWQEAPDRDGPRSSTAADVGGSVPSANSIAAASIAHAPLSARSAPGSEYSAIPPAALATVAATIDAAPPSRAIELPPRGAELRAPRTSAEVAFDPGRVIERSMSEAAPAPPLPLIAPGFVAAVRSPEGGAAARTAAQDAPLALPFDQAVPAMEQAVAGAPRRAAPEADDARRAPTPTSAPGAAPSVDAAVSLAQQVPPPPPMAGAGPSAIATAVPAVDGARLPTVALASPPPGPPPPNLASETARSALPQMARDRTLRPADAVVEKAAPIAVDADAVAATAPRDLAAAASGPRGDRPFTNFAAAMPSPPSAEPAAMPAGPVTWPGAAVAAPGTAAAVLATAGAVPLALDASAEVWSADLGRTLLALAADAPKSARLKLRPASLGELSVTIDLVDTRLRAELAVDTAAAQATLAGGLEQLRLGVARHGLTLETALVTLSGGASTGGSGAGTDPHRGGSDTPPTRAELAPGTPSGVRAGMASTTGAARRGQHGGRINVFA